MEFYFISFLRKLNKVWIGLNCIQENKKFVNVDGTPVDFTRWARNEPSTITFNFPGEKCVHFWNLPPRNVYFGWNDHGCMNRHHYLCKRFKRGND